MRILTKTIATVLAFALLGQNMLFAQQTMTDPLPTLTEIQSQAQQDMALLQQRADLYRFIANGAGIGFIFALGAFLLEKSLADQAGAAAAKTLEENFTLKEKNTQLSAITDRTRKENHALQDEINETRQMFFQESHHRKQTELYYQNHLRAAKEAKQQVVVSKEQMELLYQQQIEELQRQLGQSSLMIDQTYRFGPKADIDMTKYSDIYDAGVPQATREQLVQQLQKEPWFKELPKAEQENFMFVINRLKKEAVTNIRKETLLYATYPILQKYMVQEMSVGTQHLLALYHAFFTKGNVVMMALLTVGVLSANAQEKQTQNNEMAQRLDNNFTLFLNATPEEIAALQQNPTAYQVCAKNAAIINVLAHTSDKQLQTITEQLRQARIKQHLHPTADLAH